MLHSPPGLPHPASWAPSPYPQAPSKTLRPTPPTQRVDAGSRSQTKGEQWSHKQTIALPTPRELFSVKDAEQFVSSRRGHLDASVWVETLRDSMDGVGGVDLEVAGLEWRQYIRHHEDWRSIVGTGVVACELCSITSWDRWTCSRRTGILVTRSDGSSMCMHTPKTRTKRTRLKPHEEAHARGAYPAQATSRASPQRLASATDDAASSAATASTCVPHRARDLCTAPSRARPAADASTSVPQRAVAACPDAAAISASPQQLASATDDAEISAAAASTSEAQYKADLAACTSEPARWLVKYRHDWLALEDNTPFFKVLDESAEDEPTCNPSLLPQNMSSINEITRVGVHRFSVAWWGRHARAIFLCELKNGFTRIVAPGFGQENFIYIEGDGNMIERGR